MNCIIVEDEPAAADYLVYQLTETKRDITVQARLPSVKKTVEWLKHHGTDLIFLDVQLADGLSFDIFDHIQVNTPVIFTTSYDEYAIQAFEHNSISYLLKPLDSQCLKKALDKYRHLYETRNEMGDKVGSVQPEYQRRFLIESGHNFQSIPVEQVAYLRVQSGRYLILTDLNGKQHLLENNLERLETRLDPNMFFRVNRQFMLNIHAIVNMQAADSRGRIKIDTSPESREEILVSITKLAAFKDWLNR